MSTEFRPAVVVPALNEARTIRTLVEGCLERVPLVIVVDDGSCDGTSARLEGLPVRVLRHKAPRGKGAALWTGFREALTAGASHVVTLDGDGQHRPQDIPLLLEAARRRPRALVIGSRRAAAATMPAARRRANRVADFFLHWAGGQMVEDSQSGFRVYPRGLIERLSAPGWLRGDFVFESWAVIRAGRAGLEVVSVPIPAIYHEQLRPSHFRPVADISRITLMVTLEILSQGFALPGLLRALGVMPERVEKGLKEA